MKLNLPSLLAIISALPNLLLAIPTSQLEKRDGNGYVVLDMTRTFPPKYDYFIDDYLEEAAYSNGTTITSLANSSPSYIAELEFGSDKQKITLQVDTGSSDIWVSDSNCNYDSDNSTCPLYGTFDTLTSSSYQTNNVSFSLSYNDGDSASGIYVTDDISVSGITIKDANFAVTNSGEMGIMGIGTPYGESLLSRTGEGYDNFVVQLKDQGFINKLTTAIYLNGFNADYSNILFGAVDHCKYYGNLTLFPMLSPYGDSIPDTFLTVSSLTIGNSAEGFEAEIASGYAPAQFDTGNPITYLPAKIINSITSQIPFEYDESLDAYLIDCSITKNYYFTFNFQGLDVTVPLNQYVSSITDLSGTLLDSCYLTIETSTDVRWNLGANFMASVYLVADWENLVVGMAPALLDSTCEDIDSSGETIPSGVSAASYSQSWTANAPFTTVASPSSTSATPTNPALYAKDYHSSSSPSSHSSNRSHSSAFSNAKSSFISFVNASPRTLPSLSSRFQSSSSSSSYSSFDYLSSSTFSLQRSDFVINYSNSSRNTPASTKSSFSSSEIISSTFTQKSGIAESLSTPKIETFRPSTSKVSALSNFIPTKTDKAGEKETITNCPDFSESTKKLAETKYASILNSGCATCTDVAYSRYVASSTFEGSGVTLDVSSDSTKLAEESLIAEKAQASESLSASITTVLSSDSLFTPSSLISSVVSFAASGNQIAVSSAFPVVSAFESSGSIRSTFGFTILILMPSVFSIIML